MGIFVGIFIAVAGTVIGGFILNKLSKKKEVPPEIKKTVILVQGDLIQTIGNRNVSQVKSKLENNFIIKKGSELQTVNKEIKTNIDTKIRQNAISLVSSRCVYPQISKFLLPIARIGLDTYSSFKSVLKKKDILKIKFLREGIENLDETEEGKNLKYWIETFENLDLKGNITGILIPLIKYLDIKNISKEIIVQFTHFVEDIKNKRIKGAYNVGSKKIGIIRLGKEEKHEMRYVSMASKYKLQNYDIIIFCAMGKWITKALTSAGIFHDIFKDLDMEITGNAAYLDLDSLIKKRSNTSYISIFLIKKIQTPKLKKQSKPL